MQFGAAMLPCERENCLGISEDWRERPEAVLSECLRSLGETFSGCSITLSAAACESFKAKSPLRSLPICVLCAKFLCEITELASGPQLAPQARSRTPWIRSLPVARGVTCASVHALRIRRASSIRSHSRFKSASVAAALWPEHTRRGSVPYSEHFVAMSCRIPLVIYPDSLAISRV